jgi:hypothetical protein
LESGKTKAPDFMPIEYQLNALVMRKVSQRWYRMLAVVNMHCVFEVS